MSDASSVRGVVFAHGLMAAGLVDAVRTITGCSPDVLQALSNIEGSPEVLRDRLHGLVDGGPTVVFTDVRASSCSTLAAAAQRQGDIVSVVSGVNLPMLLHFVFHREDSVEELISGLVSRGREGIERTTPLD